MRKSKPDAVDVNINTPEDIFADTLDVASNVDLIHNSQDSSTITPPGVNPDSQSSVKRDALYAQFQPKILHNKSLDRSLVSNQANKKLPFYSWFKYKEGFSEPFVDYIISHVLKARKPGILLDPFSGSGSALFGASIKGWRTKGIEVLPVGVYATQARFIAERVNVESFQSTVKELVHVNFADYYTQDYELKHIAITNGAFPQIEERQLVGYVSYCQQYISDEDIRALLLYAAFCILEEISYTRKDGQYLRWDARSGRSQGESIHSVKPLKIN